MRDVETTTRHAGKSNLGLVPRWLVADLGVAPPDRRGPGMAGAAKLKLPPHFGRIGLAVAIPALISFPGPSSGASPIRSRSLRAFTQSRWDIYTSRLSLPT